MSKEIIKPCMKCRAEMMYNEYDNTWQCKSCTNIVSNDFMLGYGTGLIKGQADSKLRIEQLVNQLKRASGQVKRIAKSTPVRIKKATISAADVKRFISEEYRRHGYDKKQMPAPKDIDNEFLLWTGAKIKKDKSGPQVSYYILGYAIGGDDVTQLLSWLHNI